MRRTCLYRAVVDDSASRTLLVSVGLVEAFPGEATTASMQQLLFLEENRGSDKACSALRMRRLTILNCDHIVFLELLTITSYDSRIVLLIDSGVSV